MRKKIMDIGERKKRPTRKKKKDGYRREEEKANQNKMKERRSVLLYFGPSQFFGITSKWVLLLPS